VAIPLEPSTLLLVALVVAVAGLVNGVAGFGFAVVGTMVLAGVFEPATAVVFMILPIVAVNLSLARDLSGEQVRTCGRRFAPLLVTATVGTIVGLWALEWLPASPLRVGLGVITLGFVASSQRVVGTALLGRFKSRCFVGTAPWMAVIGAISGLLFGATNVGVQLVAYVRSQTDSHQLFVGVVAMVFLGVNGLRVLAAGTLGLFPDLATVALSFGAMIPAVIGVALGRRLRGRLPESVRRGAVLGLLAIIGVQLVGTGIGLW